MISQDSNKQVELQTKSKVLGNHEGKVFDVVSLWMQEFFNQVSKSHDKLFAFEVFNKI